MSVSAFTKTVKLVDLVGVSRDFTVTVCVPGFWKVYTTPVTVVPVIDNAYLSGVISAVTPLL
ncbi:hypothetical protein D3C75_1333420 [compost metagenome]